MLLEGDSVTDNRENSRRRSIGVKNKKVDRVPGVKVTGERAADTARTSREIHTATSHNVLVRFVERGSSRRSPNSERIRSVPLRNIDKSPIAEVLSISSSC